MDLVRILKILFSLTFHSSNFHSNSFKLPYLTFCYSLKSCPQSHYWYCFHCYFLFCLARDTIFVLISHNLLLNIVIFYWVDRIKFEHYVKYFYYGFYNFFLSKLIILQVTKTINFPQFKFLKIK